MSSRSRRRIRLAQRNDRHDAYELVHPPYHRGARRIGALDHPGAHPRRARIGLRTWAQRRPAKKLNDREWRPIRPLVDARELTIVGRASYSKPSDDIRD